MHTTNLPKVLLCLWILFSIGKTSVAQTNQEQTKKKHKRTGSLYFSWGYNGEWYTRSTVHVKGSGEGGTDYQLIHVQASDHKGWDEGIFNKALTIPQYNYRLGYYFNEKQDLAIELNFDHTKYIIVNGQNIHFKGTFQGRPLDSNIVFSENNGFYYYLNNGANFFLVNLVKRVGLYHAKNNKLRIDFTGKAGIGPVVPHVQNSFFGEANDPHFQLGGWNTGVETAFRFIFMHYVYLEMSQKGDYARYSGLKLYNGKAKQNFGTYELILSLGLTIPTTNHNPMFANGASIK